MANRTYDRRHTMRSRNRRGAQNDAIVVALTAQIIVCVVLLFTCGILKKVDEPRYDLVKSEYVSLATASEAGEGEGVLEQISTEANGWLEAAEETIAGWFGGGQTVVNGPGYEDGAVDDSVLPADPVGGEIHTDGFGYDYISPGGMGGMYEVDLGEDGSLILTAPEGTTLDPVAFSGNIMAPVEGMITSGYAYRYHPISGNTDFHTGLDIAAEEGRAILSALPGEVWEVGESDVYGNYIIVQHAGDLQTLYAHCSEIIAEEGTMVRRGERIAKVGETGIATGPHLHFSVILEGTYIDPVWLLSDNIRVVE